MRPTLTFILLSAMACMSAPPLLRAGDLEADSAESAVFFDGAAKYRAKTESPSPAAEDKERLTAELRKQLTLNDHGSPEERAVLDSMISRMMDSPTAREVAVQFIQENASAIISLEELPGSTEVTVDGKKTFWGPLGSADPGKYPPVVKMNKLFMRYDMDRGAGSLAHETLGHALESRRAHAASADYYRYNMNEEENARLIGWLVSTELNVKPVDGIWAYMQNPEEEMKSIKMVNASYAQKFTSLEMKNPVAVYESCLMDADKELEQLREKSVKYEKLIKIVDHFVTGHKMDSASFQTIRDDIDNAIKLLPVMQRRFELIKTVLQGQLKSFSDANGNVVLEKLSKESDNGYYSQKDATIKERRGRLERLLLGKTPESFKTPPPVGQITWPQFKELRAKDSDSCPFGGIK